MNLEAQLALQKQTVQSAIVEVESALEELENSSEAYKLVGNILIKSDAQKLKKELQEKKEILTKRLESIQAQIKNE
ncbi:hypothetical protein D6774_02560 [Candidatus Woesearchaeota archaeon]|jgi:chaperonin cofactor prefoldin|nr:MAG: hypothetical protein D6774_02560 [Candidatus Woesearchaeota archaeon]